MNYRIYQCYYKTEHQARLTPEFTSFDNRSNPHPELREYYLALELRDLARSSGLDMWGMMGPTWNS